MHVSQSGMVVILFRSRLTAEAGDDYHHMAAEMLATARWRNHPRHRVAQKAGRDRWYENYTIEIAEVVRGGAFERPEA
jgi:hypothetical protein